jgi:hypothetical protein
MALIIAGISFAITCIIYALCFSRMAWAMTP